jgi:hypothetical protein
VDFDLLRFHPALGVEVLQIHTLRGGVGPGHFPLTLVGCDGAKPSTTASDAVYQMGQQSSKTWNSETPPANAKSLRARDS